MSSDNKTQYYIVNAFLRIILIFISFFFAEKNDGVSANSPAGTRRAVARFVFTYRLFRYTPRSGVSAGAKWRAREDCAAPPALAHVPHPRGGNGTASADDVSALSIRVPGAGTLRGKRSTARRCSRGSAHFSFLRILMKASCGRISLPLPRTSKTAWPIFARPER